MTAWTAETLPPGLAAILDERAGRVHSPTGAVRSCLADILNAYDTLRETSPMTTPPTPSGTATSHDRIPADVFNTAMAAAFPGLPEGMSLDEAGRRVAAALNATRPVIEQRVREHIADEIQAYARQPVTLAQVLELSPTKVLQHAELIARGHATRSVVIEFPPGLSAQDKARIISAWTRPDEAGHRGPYGRYEAELIDGRTIVVRCRQHPDTPLLVFPAPIDGCEDEIGEAIRGHDREFHGEDRRA